ncbi:hypothetical protein AMAG_10325 [Allomyces macrogynus ATCC 38327]|uniref:HIG1 domain-containing protein n=1 Tax=Allomyces macrogynus (strain ATCC 38327) TaxID=578462 RepID=A0A0L0SU72_ALLM3|nr:hypothetical protein AMAG_10325 [Allomyces macrogynus ATCC 38327]|eukprot:KNE66062.1 hypothetical protein AMAG_10325 [Allomyces macrogynus ATCC 38327]
MSSPSSPSDSNAAAAPAVLNEIPYVKGVHSAIEEKKRQEEFDALIREYAFRGGVIGLAVGVAGVMIGSRISTNFNALTTPFKVFLISSAATAGLVIEGERATFHSPASRYHYHQVLQEQVHAAEHHEQVQESALDQARDWALDHRYQLTLGIWVAAMGGSFFSLYRNKNLGMGQKIVQARVYAQGAVLAALMATAGLQALGSKKPRVHHAPQAYLYPWEVEEQEKLKVAAAASGNAPKSA